MDEPASKRRRTSPRLSGSGSPPTANAPEPSSQRTQSKRPSWASPTKASMARWNPEILERRRSASPPKPPSPTRAARQPSFPGSDASLSEMLFARPQGNPLASAPALPEVGEGQPRRGSSPTRPSSRGSVRGGMSAAPRRSPAKPSPRPLPPPAPEGEGDFDPFARRGLRRSPQTGLGPRHMEPELPPSVDDPVSSTPPRGIHNSSSPSHRRSTKRRKTTAMTSPLKQPPARPDDEEQPEAPAQKSLFGNKGSPLKQPPLRPGDENILAKSPSKSNRPTRSSRLGQTTALAESTNNIRRLPSSDSNIEKKKERDALRAQLATLKKDLEVTSRQNERIRAMQRTGRMVPLGDEKETMQIIQRHLLPSEADPGPTQSHLLMKAALNPMALVPYGKPAASAIPSEEDEVDISNIKSHHPVPMTAKEELPFLQLFTPFSASSTLVVLPQAPDEAFKQLFTIQLRSRHCPGLFGAKLEATVDATSLSVLSLKIAALEPSAKYELGGFLEKICTGDCNRSMQRNVGIVTWAMSEWLRVAEQRAHLWVQLDAELGTKDGLLESSANVRSRKGKHGKDEGNDEHATSPMAKSQLLRHMGRQSFDVQIPSDDGSAPASLRLSWKIEFDWSGEAKSNVTVMAGVPGKWHDADSKGALGKIPSLFEDLVDGGEESVLAMRKVVALIVGEA